MAKLNENNGKTYLKVASADTGKNEKQELPKVYGYGVRHIQAFLIFTSLTITFITRAHLSVTIVAMTDIPRKNSTSVISETNSTNIDFNNNDTNLVSTNKDDRASISICQNGTYKTFKYENRAEFEKLVNVTENNCAENNDHARNNVTNSSIIEGPYFGMNDTASEKENNSIWNVYKTYDWSKAKQEMVLGAFFLGYLIMMTPMGMVAQRWGGKLPLQISLFCSAFFNFFTPWLAVWGDYKAVSLTRTAMGLVQAGTYPSIHSLIAKWVPLSERGRLGTYIYTGSMLGSVLSSHVAGLLAASVFGWPSIYWVIGVLSFVMAVLITLFGAASPHQHPSITQEEKNYIVGSDQEHVEIRWPTPWKAIFTSKPLWATIITHMATTTIYLFFFAQVPTYLHHIIGLNIKNSGLLSSLPYLGNFVTSIVAGYLCDYCVNNNITSLRVVRIISNTMANVGSGACLIAVSFTTNPTIAVSGLVLCMMMQAGVHTGWMMSYIDLAPNFSGTLMATGNTFMNLCACTMPVLVSHVVTDVTNVYQWRIVMFVVTAVGCAGNLVYMVFMSADVQPWNDAAYDATSQVDSYIVNSEEKQKPK